MQWRQQNAERSARTETAEIPVSPEATRWLWKRLSALLVEGLTQREAAAGAWDWKRLWPSFDRTSAPNTTKT